MSFIPEQIVAALLIAGVSVCVGIRVFSGAASLFCLFKQERARLKSECREKESAAQALAEFNDALDARKRVRIVEQERARKAYWQAQRKRWANDPVRAHG